MRSKSAQVITLFLLLLPPAAAVLHAGGAPEDPIARAEALIGEERYTEAILALTDALGEDPEYFDAATGLIERINVVREAFAGVLEELLTTIEENPENTDDALALLEQLEDIDPFPSSGIAEILQETRFAIQLTAARNEALAIVRDARDLIARERYRDAVLRYLDGFALLEEQFQEADYYQVDGIGAGAERARTDAQTAAEAAAELFAPLLSASRDTLEALEAGDGTTAGERFDLVRLRYAEIRALQESLRGAADRIAQANAQISRLTGDSTRGDWHLEFVEQFLRGDGNEGIVATVGVAARDSISGIPDKSLAAAELRYDQAFEAFIAGNYDDATAGLEELEPFASLATEAGALARGIEIDGETRLPVLMEALPEDFRDEVFRLKAAGLLEPVIPGLGSLVADYRDTAAQPGDTVPELLSTRDATAALIDRSNSLESDLASLREGLEGPTEALAGGGPLFDSVARAIDESRTDILDLANTVAAGIAAARVAEVAEEIEALEGLAEAPRTPRIRLETVVSEVPGVEDAIETLRLDIAEEPPQVRESPMIIAALETAEDLDTRLQVLEGNALGRIAEIDLEPLETRADQLQNDTEQARERLALSEEPRVVPESAMLARVEQDLQEVRQGLPDLIDELQDYLSRFTARAQGLRRPERLSESLDRGEELQGELVALETEVVEGLAAVDVDRLVVSLAGLEERLEETESNLPRVATNESDAQEAEEAFRAIRVATAQLETGIEDLAREYRRSATGLADPGPVLDQVERAQLLESRTARLQGEAAGGLALVELSLLRAELAGYRDDFQSAQSAVRAGLGRPEGPSQDAESRARGLLVPVDRDVPDTLARVRAFSDEYEAEAEELQVPGPVLEEVAAADAVRESLEDLHGEVVGLLGSLDLVPLRNRLSQLNRVVQEGEAFLNGVVEQGRELPSRYPDRAREALVEARDLVPALVADAGEYVDEYRARDGYLAQEPPVVERIQDGTTLRREVQALSTRISGLLDEADDALRLASELRSEYNRLLTEAQSLIDNLQVATARQRYEAATDAARDALDVAYDADFEAQVNAQRAQLFERIASANRNLVSGMVTEMLAEAESLYQQEEYASAFSVILDAEEQWLTEFPDTENPSLVILRRQVQAQLELETERVLLPTDPLYENLVGFLNDARLSFEHAQELIDEGKEAEGRRFLTAAEEAIRNVVAVKPSNWDAKLLRLEIAQVLDRDNFGEVFENRYEEALARLSDSTYVEVLTELEALLSVDPDYPGLAEEINDIKLEYGLIEPPRTEQEIDRSQQLVTQAQNLAATGNQDSIRQAIALLDQAIQINPRNSAAAALYNNLQVQLQPQTAPMTVEDERNLARALNLYNENSLVEAYRIVEELWSNELYRGDRELRNLRNLISRRLNL